MSVNIYDKENDTLIRIAGGTLYSDMPVGSISPFGGSAIPNGYLLCDGTEVLKTAYAELYAVIGDAFGTASDNTKFKLPDLRLRFLEGASASQSSNVGNFIAAGLPNITGSLEYSNTVTEWGNNQPITSFSGALSASNTTSNVSTSGAYAGYGAKSISFNARNSNSLYGNSNTVQPSAVCVNYIIKAKQVAAPADFTDYVKDFIISKFVQIDVPAQSGVGEYTVNQTLTIPTGYKFLAFGSVSCVHYNQVLMSATFNNDTNVATIRIYNDYGAITALERAVKAWVLYVKA